MFIWHFRINKMCLLFITMLHAQNTQMWPDYKIVRSKTNPIQTSKYCIYCKLRSRSSVLGTFKQVASKHSILLPSYPVDRITDRLILYLTPHGSVLKDKSADSNKNEYPSLIFSAVLPCISRSANNPSHNPACHLAVADMSACSSDSRATTLHK